ncbi:hypothetical protein [Lactobacillus equicursoris]|uniref:hypothetical protein n=1 Tax=Lactobacillus equicursoris TaxID=420645 RepID=UPI0039935BB7
MSTGDKFLDFRPQSMSTGRKFSFFRPQSMSTETKFPVFRPQSMSTEAKCSIFRPRFMSTEAKFLVFCPQFMSTEPFFAPKLTQPRHLRPPFYINQVRSLPRSISTGLWRPIFYSTIAKKGPNQMIRTFLL